MARKFLALLIGAATIPLLAVAQAQNKTTALIKAGRVVDVRNARVLTNQAILIEGDLIKEIGSADTVTAHSPANTRVIDLTNATVLPGLIDCH
ncbi:MAG TPA: amidohydrolase family protein, partial [Blastocatellia bacterium]|nr:amidohydrolase family protein [Blastocatellia bacterium]